MAKLTPEERAELQRQLDDDAALDDDFEIEIRDGDKATRVPYSKGRPWLQQHFGIDLPPLVEDEPEEDAPKGGKLKAAPEPRRFGGRRVS